ncbi:hypothetical protein FGB62_12g412 [Gracilaria domingensis]|nr:hypothetical protein FGB62_12g412 [Gracilaria domingensis]
MTKKRGSKQSEEKWQMFVGIDCAVDAYNTTSRSNITEEKILLRWGARRNAVGPSERQESSFDDGHSTLDSGWHMVAIHVCSQYYGLERARKDEWLVLGFEQTMFPRMARERKKKTVDRWLGGACSVLALWRHNAQTACSQSQCIPVMCKPRWLTPFSFVHVCLHGAAQARRMYIRAEQKQRTTRDKARAA